MKYHPSQFQPLLHDPEVYTYSRTAERNTLFVSALAVLIVLLYLVHKDEE